VEIFFLPQRIAPSPSPAAPKGGRKVFLHLLPQTQDFTKMVRFFDVIKKRIPSRPSLEKIRFYRPGPPSPPQNPSRKYPLHGPLTPHPYRKAGKPLFAFFVLKLLFFPDGVFTFFGFAPPRLAPPSSDRIPLFRPVPLPTRHLILLSSTFGLSEKFESTFSQHGAPSRSSPLLEYPTSRAPPPHVTSPPPKCFPSGGFPPFFGNHSPPLELLQYTPNLPPFSLSGPL